MQFHSKLSSPEHVECEQSILSILRKGTANFIMGCCSWRRAGLPHTYHDLANIIYKFAYFNFTFCTVN